MPENTPPSGDAAAIPDAGPVDRHDDERVKELLHDHVPLSLLVDLAEPENLDSRAILEQEGEPEGQWWEPGTP